jgi:ATP-dependent 26S proteasome regulatory subunit
LLPDDCDHLGGLDPQLQQLWEAAALPLAAPKWAPARGALLTGDPGTGKTAAVRWLAKKLRNVGHVIVRKAADCLGRFHGDAERELQSVFHEAGKLAPCVVFFDEIDALASSRSNNNQQGSQKGTVATMLSLLDSLPSQVAVIAATCRPADVDAALRRPGRLDREIHF